MRRYPQRCRLLTAILLLLVLSFGCEPERETPRLAVTNSYLEAAVRELVGADTPILRLAEPGMCPGHFDIRPSQARALAKCEVLLRFDFQASLDAKLVRGEATQVMPVSVQAGLASPAGYWQACAQIAEALDVAPATPQAVHARMVRLEAQAQAALAAADLQGVSVICSRHQSRACRQLGLTVAAEFAAADQATLRQIDAVLATGKAASVRCVIANRPEGAELATAIATRLDVPIVVFHNFPDCTTGEPDFDRMYLGNVNRLLEALGP